MALTRSSKPSLRARVGDAAPSVHSILSTPSHTARWSEKRTRLSLRLRVTASALRLRISGLSTRPAAANPGRE